MRRLADVLVSMPKSPEKRNNVLSHSWRIVGRRALVADSLCCGQGKPMMRKPEIQIGNSNSKSSNKLN
jgi:hypothetical protein